MPFTYTSPSSSTSGLNIDQILAQRAQNPPDEGGGVLGLLGNAWEGITGMVGGIGSLIGAGIHDTTQFLGDMADLKAGEADYKLDDIAKGILGVDPQGSFWDPQDWHPMADTSMVGTIWDRWAPLAQGHFREFGEGLYEDPMGALLDVASVASLGAGAASKVGQAGIAGTKGASVADDVLRALSQSKAAGIGSATSRAMKGASVRAGLEEIGKGGTLTAKLLPKTKLTLREGAGGIAGTGLFPSTEAFNPLYRGVSSLVKRPMTQSIDDLVARAKQLDADIQAMPQLSESLIPEKALLDRTISVLKSRKNTFPQTRIESPRLAHRLTGIDTMKATLTDSERFFRTRDEKMREAVAGMYTTRDRLRQSGVTNPEQYMDNAALGRLRYDVVGAEKPYWVGGPQPVNLLDPDGQMIRLGDEAATGGGVATVTRVREVNPQAVQMAQSLDNPLVKRVRAQQAVNDAYVQHLTENVDELTASGEDVAKAIDMTQRANRMLEDDLLTMLDPTPDDARLIEAQNIAGQRLIDMERMSGGDWASAGLKPDDVLQRYYEGLGAKHGWDIDADGNLVIPEGAPTLQQLDDWFHEANATAPVYFPFQDPTRLKGSALFRAKQPVASNILARDPHNNKLRLALLKQGKWSNDAIETASRRAAFRVREAETLKAWTTNIEKFGLRIDNPRSVPHGYVLAAPDILRVNFKLRTTFLKSIDEALSKGAEPEAAVARALKDALKASGDDVMRLGNEGKIAMYAVPEVMMKNLDSAAKYAQVFGGKGVQLYYDTAMNLWRGLALTASPRWVLNNVLGNLGFSFMQGAKITDAIRIGTERQRAIIANWLARKDTDAGRAMSEMIGGTELRPSSLAGQLRNRVPGVEDVGPGYIGDILEQKKAHLPQGAEDLLFGKTIARRREAFPASFWSRAGQGMKTLNGNIEQAFREASYLTALERQAGRAGILNAGRSFSRAATRIDKLMKDGLDPSTAKGAAKIALGLDEMNHFFGNYGRMTPFERHVIRRWIAPFWGFYRHSSKLMLMFPFEYPGRAHLLQAIDTATEEMIAEYGPLPEWMRSPMPIGPPGAGNIPILSGAGANPFAGPAEGVAGLMGMASPFIKTGYEQITGRNAFTGEEFTSKDTFTPYGSDQAYDINTLQPVDKVSPGFLQMLVSQIPQFDMIRDTIAGGNTYDLASIADALQQRMGDMGEATPIDPETGQPYYDVTAADTLSKIFGYNVFNYDLEAYQERQRQEQLAVLREALERGVA